MSSNLQICPRCHAGIQIRKIHGHYQCQICKSNIDDCCSGETCQPTIVYQEEDIERPPTSP